MDTYKKIQLPKKRIATLDVCEIGRKQHHIKALLELDVTEIRIAIENIAVFYKIKEKQSYFRILIYPLQLKENMKES